MDDMDGVEADEFARESLAERLHHVATITQMFDLVDQVRSVASPADGEGVDAARGEIASVLRQLETSLPSIEPMLVTDSLVNGLNNSLTALLNSLTQFWPGNPRQAVSPLPGVADHVRGFVSVSGTARADAMTRVEATATATVEEAQQASAVLKSLIDELEVEKGERFAEFDQLQASHKELLENSEAGYSKSIESFKERIEKVRADAELRYENDRVAFVKSFEEANDEAEATLTELRRTLGIAGDESLSAGYGQRADTEDEAADKLRGRAVAFGVAGAAAAVGSLIWAGIAEATVDDNDPWTLLPLKLGLVLVLGAIAAYYGRQSERHRNFARRLRVNQLELHNIGSYLAELSPPERAEVKRDLVTSFFGQQPGEHKDDSPTGTASADQLLELLKVALKN